VAAVVAAVAGSVAISVYLASDAERQRRAYDAFLPTGTVRLAAQTSDGRFTDADAALAVLPVRQLVASYTVAGTCGESDSCGGWSLALPEHHTCAPGDLRCQRSLPMSVGLLAGGPGIVEVATGHRDAAAEAALRVGRVVVFDERFVTGGTVTLVHERYVDGGPRDVRRITLPAVALDAEPLGEAPAALLTVETARWHHLPLARGSTYVLTTRMPTEREEAAARNALLRERTFADVYVERGFRNDNDVALLALALAAGLVTLAATAIATGLAAADSRPDLATLAAVGAAPRIRRRLVMAQAATVAALGSGLGLLAGLVPAAAVVAARKELPLALPWGSFAISAVGVPLLAALAVAAFTRSRLPMERRLV
jgi:putative ABC transport system permease protein